MGWRLPVCGLFVLGLVVAHVACEDLDLVMPARTVTGKDTYLCTTVKLAETGKRIVAIEPHSDQSIAHHMLLFGCDEPNTPGEDEAVWECHMRPSCMSNEKILYGWGKNAPKLSLPDGVGFTIGGQSGIRHLVLQVHYLDVRPQDDVSGVTLTLSDKPSPLTASMLTYVVGFRIPPRKKSHLIHNSCCVTGFQEVTTMAFRVHTHVMGRSVYMTRTSGLYPNGTEIARNDPQKPQGFYPVEKERRIRPGENLRVTCDFDSSEKDHPVGAGHTHDDEMCNMCDEYMMLYSEMPHFSTCMQSHNDEDMSGPGGFPVQPVLLPESSISGDWKPPIADLADSEGIQSVSGVARAANGSIWVLHRGSQAWNADSFSANFTFKGDPIEQDVVVELDSETGSMKQQWGKGHFYMPHMITVDYDGYIWITDTGRHQALKFNQKGELLMELGIKLEPGHDDNHFCQPAQVQILNDGRILVTDGYCNSRVMIFTKAGKFESKVENNEMSIVHSITVDECMDRLFIADRENSRVFEYSLSTLKKVGSVNYKKFGKVWSITKGPYGSIFILAWNPGHSATLISKTPTTTLTWEKLNITFGVSSKVPGITKNKYPHDLTIGPAPMKITGVENRYLAVYISSTSQGVEVGGIDMYVLVPDALKEELQTSKSTAPSQESYSEDAIMDGHAAIKQDIHESRADGKGLDDTSNPDVVNAAHVVNASPDADVSKLESELTQREQSDAPKEHAQPPSGQEGSVILAGAENPEDSRINQGLDEGSSSTAGEYYGTITSVGGAYQPWRLFFIGLFSVGCLYMVFNYFKRGKSPRRNH